MKVLCGCEESQKLTNAFRLLGHDAFSVDILPTRGNPDYHFQEDIVSFLERHGGWDLIILTPDCTKMAVSGNRHYAKNKPRHNERIDAVEWTLKLWALAKSRSKGVVLENPNSVIFPHLPNVQYIQPWQFGHGETKKTGLALHNVPRLKPTNIVDGREQRIWKMAPSPTRKRDRSEFYQGVCDAMADQWGKEEWMDNLFCKDTLKASIITKIPDTCFKGCNC